MNTNYEPKFYVIKKYIFILFSDTHDLFRMVYISADNCLSNVFLTQQVITLHNTQLIHELNFLFSS